MMKQQFRKSILAVGVLGLMAGMSGSVLAASAEGTTDAVVEDSINIVETAQFSFGRFARTDTGGIVNVDEISCDANTVLPHFGNEACGRFRVTGAAGESYSINYPNSATITNTDGSGSSMTYDLALDDDGDNVKTLDGNGRSDLQFGGSLQVNPGQNPGTYVGNYIVSVDYINAN